MDTSHLHQRADTKYTTQDGTKTVYKPKGLRIIWGNDKRFWKIDDKVAELLQLNWVEVTGIAEHLKPQKTYKISFEISLEPHAFGWEGIQVYVMAKVDKQGKYVKETFFPDKEDNTEFSVQVSTGNSIDQTLYFGLYEISSGVWKGGLKIYKATVEEIQEKIEQIKN